MSPPIQNYESQFRLRDLFITVAICAVTFSLAKLNNTGPTQTVAGVVCVMIGWYCFRAAIIKKTDIAAIILSAVFLLWAIFFIAFVRV